jgi:hypothetical protein
MITIHELQLNLPWTIRYSRDFRASPQTHKDFAHALHHVSKAAGKLHALVDDMDHDREVADDPTLRARNAKYVADLVVCALRLANTFPGGVVDLERAVLDRIQEKNTQPKAPEIHVPAEVLPWGPLPKGIDLEPASDPLPGVEDAPVDPVMDARPRVGPKKFG